MRAKRQITGRLGQYVPPGPVEEMSQHPEAFSMDGECLDMCVLFTDVRGFTVISEGLDLKELSKLMNEFLTPLTQVIYVKFLERTEQARINPPVPGWDGATAFDTK
jgi:adenylate cyclase